MTDRDQPQDDQPQEDQPQDDQPQEQPVQEESAAGDGGIVRTIKSELFSNPFKAFGSYLKRLWAYMKLTFLQFRNPVFLIDEDPGFSIQKRGIFFPVLFKFLNPLGKTGQEKVDKLDHGYVAYSKESISLLVFTVLLQLAFKEMSDQETAGNLEVALTNGMVLILYFISVLIFALLGRFMTRKVSEPRTRRLLQEMFVYEVTMVFGFVIILMTLQSFGVVESEGPLLITMFLFAAVHPYYFLIGINRRVRITNFLGIFGWGTLLALVASVTFLFTYAFVGMTSGALEKKPAAEETQEAPAEQETEQKQEADEKAPAESEPAKDPADTKESPPDAAFTGERDLPAWCRILPVEGAEQEAV